MTDRVVPLSTTKAYVFSDSVLCMGRISENPVSAWNEKIDWFQSSLQYNELDRIDGEPMEFEWKNFPGFTTLQILAEIQNKMTEIQCEFEQFPGRIIFMSMYIDIVCGEKGNEEMCVAKSKIVEDYAKRSAHGQWSFLGPGSETKWYGTRSFKPNGKWDRVAEDMMLNPYSVDPVPWDEEIWKAKEKGNCPYTSVATTKPWKWFFARSSPSISSVSTEQWRTCATNWLAKISGCSERTGKLVAHENSRNHGYSSRIDDDEQITWDR